MSRLAAVDCFAAPGPFEKERSTGGVGALQQTLDPVNKRALRREKLIGKLIEMPLG